MTCCGKKRKALSKEAQSSQEVNQMHRNPTLQRKIAKTPVYFQYLGHASLKVVGPQTRKLYHFRLHRSVVAVDPRDQFALANVPTLRKVIKTN